MIECRNCKFLITGDDDICRFCGTPRVAPVASALAVAATAYGQPAAPGPAWAAFDAPPEQRHRSQQHAPSNQYMPAPPSPQPYAPQPFTGQQGYAAPRPYPAQPFAPSAPAAPGVTMLEAYRPGMVRDAHRQVMVGVGIITTVLVVLAVAWIATADPVVTQQATPIFGVPGQPEPTFAAPTILDPDLPSLAIEPVWQSFTSPSGAVTFEMPGEPTLDALEPIAGQRPSLWFANVDLGGLTVYFTEADAAGTGLTEPDFSPAAMISGEFSDDLLAMPIQTIPTDRGEVLAFTSGVTNSESDLTFSGRAFRAGERVILVYVVVDNELVNAGLSPTAESIDAHMWETLTING